MVDRLWGDGAHAGGAVVASQGLFAVVTGPFAPLNLRRRAGLAPGIGDDYLSLNSDSARREGSLIAPRAPNPRPDQGLCGAADGTRTHDIQLGKLGLRGGHRVRLCTSEYVRVTG
jgi:hypothetical protein